MANELQSCPSPVITNSRCVQLLNIGLGAVTAAVNMVLELYSQWAVARELYTGRTRAQATTAHAQFMAQFLNTVAVNVRLFRLLCVVLMAAHSTVCSEERILWL